MGAPQLLAEIDTPDAEDQQPPAGIESHSTVAEVRVAAEGLDLALMDVRAGICTYFCHARLLVWGCWKQRAEGHLMRPKRLTPGPISKPRPPTTSSSKGTDSKTSVGSNSGCDQDVVRMWLGSGLSMWSRLRL